MPWVQAPEMKVGYPVALALDRLAESSIKPIPFSSVVASTAHRRHTFAFPIYFGGCHVAYLALAFAHGLKRGSSGRKREYPHPVRFLRAADILPRRRPRPQESRSELGVSSSPAAT